jgi:hypothetical protein
VATPNLPTEAAFADAQDQDSLSLSRPWHNTLSWTLAEVSLSDKGVQGEGDPKCHAEAGVELQQTSDSEKPIQIRMVPTARPTANARIIRRP